MTTNRIQSKDLKVGMEIQISPDHCLEINSIKVSTFKSSGITKITVNGKTRDFTKTDSQYWGDGLNSKNLK